MKYGHSDLIDASVAHTRVCFKDRGCEVTSKALLSHWPLLSWSSSGWPTTIGYLWPCNLVGLNTVNTSYLGEMSKYCKVLWIPPLNTMMHLSGQKGHILVYCYAQPHYYILSLRSFMHVGSLINKEDISTRKTRPRLQTLACLGGCTVKIKRPRK